MRLLETTMLELSEFVEGHIPEYAILSHTWGDEEVLFRDLEKGPSAKAGWTKIQSACRVARERGHSWIWIDTCCIDKASSSELSEALNSMFKWYQGARLCLAYLSDVAYYKPGTDKCGTALAGSRWFTRGWTLQELLAPSSLVFYAQDWRLLGLRGLFDDVIEQRTGIERPYLSEGRSLESASVAERMSWASQRMTTRTEDVAYCLLGIFDVNMPLIYGEGTKAFKRLQEAIILDNNDQSIFAWGTICEEDTVNLPSFPEDPDGLPLFAASPTDFKGCGDVEPIPNGIPSAPLRVETSGITIVTPLLVGADYYKWSLSRPSTNFLAPLLCRRRNQVFNVIALALDSTDRPTPDSRLLEGRLFYRRSRLLLTFPITVWASGSLCSTFIKFQPSSWIGVEIHRVFAQKGCAVRTLPKGSYGLASPIVIPLKGPLGSHNDGEGELALVLQYQYFSKDADDSGILRFETEPSWMVNRVVNIPPGSTIEAVAHTVQAESEAWPAEYVRRISGASKRPESGGDSELLSDLFNRSSLRTFTRFHVGVTNEPVHDPLHIVDVVDLMGENVSLERHHFGRYTPVKGT
ncbi:HET domain-containing protein [Colletotrichum phormii]|uniref:HET domain-containing protein n=1 Tax=Colletotrichum phormii TaxID=359342 RepID=A0AAI9ZE49_9PEZI|nr:HET domain-containing protein [Colletotrichum phormii]KAK1621846.1 HET domain-containing protein [Colletotrichum phormii]